jgi:hypothetical protein
MLQQTVHAGRKSHLLLIFPREMSPEFKPVWFEGTTRFFHENRWFTRGDWSRRLVLATSCPCKVSSRLYRPYKMPAFLFYSAMVYDIWWWRMRFYWSLVFLSVDFNIGRGIGSTDEEGRRFIVNTVDVKVWHVKEYTYNPLPEEDYGHFHSCEGDKY